MKFGFQSRSLVITCRKCGKSFTHEVCPPTLSIGPDQQDTVVVTADTCPICLIREAETRWATSGRYGEPDDPRNDSEQS